MKFTDGYWMLREGVRALYPVTALDVATGAGSLTVHAPGKPIRDREDMTRDPLTLVTLECAAPMPDVIGVTITHFTGAADRGPHLELLPDLRPAPAPGTGPVPVPVPCAGATEDADTAVLSSGALSLRVNRGPDWRVDFMAGGRVLTSSGTEAMAFMETADGGHYVREQLDLGIDHFVYGLGERFGPLVRNGQAVDIWNADGGTTSEQAYKNVPFFLTNAGYGVFVDHPGHVSLEVASENVSRVQFSIAGQSMRYFVIYGPTPKEILRKYTALTGRPARLPLWSYGLWLSTSFTTDYDEQTVTGFVEGMAKRNLPISVFHFDCFWMREFNWCDFEWDPRVFPDPPGMLRRLKERGLRICVWINPYIAQRSPLFAEGKALGHLLKRPNGDVWQCDKWQPGLAVVDFTSPAAREWYAAKLDALLDMGVDCFKTDFGERIPTDVVHADGSDPERMHNHYTYLYNRTVFDLLRERRGEGEAIVFARSAAVGSQRFPVHWSGDSESTFEAMAQSLRGGLSLGLSGFGYWSHDIGGFEGRPDPAVFKRWIAFGLLSSHSRLHGRSSYRVPWLFDEEAVDVLREFTRLKMRLMPYLAGAARQASGEGLPMMRAMVLEFPDDPACTHLDRQYLLGDDLLVAPVFCAAGEVSYYVPDGVWTHYLTGEPVPGGRWVRERHGFDSVPLLVRPGAVIPEGAVDDRPEYDFADGVTLRVYEPADGVRVTTEIPAADGVDGVDRTDGTDRGASASASYVTSRSGPQLKITASTRRTGDTAGTAGTAGDAGRAGGWSVLLVGVWSVADVTGGTAGRHEQGTLVAATGHEIVITLRDPENPVDQEGKH